MASLEAMEAHFDELLAALSGLSAPERAALLCGRAGDPGWPAPPGWAATLLALPPLSLGAAERRGLSALPSALSAAFPPTLAALCRAVAGASDGLGIDASAAPAAAEGGGEARRLAWRQREEKAEQLRALHAALEARLEGGRLRRVVDVGCGKGHATAALAAALQLPALGVDRDAKLLNAARQTYPHVSFEACDVLAPELSRCLRDGDLVLGLHPCGALGEAVVSTVAELNRGGERRVSLVMIPCCWHKQGTPLRPPLSARARRARLWLPHAALKKASMALDSSSSVDARRARHGLRELLARRGVDQASLDRREEMDGIKAAKAKRGLAVLAQEALAKRGLQPARAEEIAEIERDTAAEFERIRRLSLLEPLLGEYVELLGLLDRAMCLAELHKLSKLAVMLWDKHLVTGSVVLGPNRDILRQIPNSREGRPCGVTEQNGLNSFKDFKHLALCTSGSRESGEPEPELRPLRCKLACNSLALYR
ncbi:hypothetical protein AB1Y20_014017 [Prymnesium parvum]|uniref:Methyltransferase domain-containing protein n=1 Tax=Prymnesium parvum TaxID=97485 RepID=A0AB34IH67_PRYPA